MSRYQYISDDKTLSVTDFLSLVNEVWPGDYPVQHVKSAIEQTINITAWDDDKLIGCVRILTDGYFFGTIPQILVLPHYQGKGVGRELMELTWKISPTPLFFGAQSGKEEFFEKMGYTKSLQSFQRKKERKK